MSGMRLLICLSVVFISLAHALPKSIPGRYWVARDTLRPWSSIASSSDGSNLVASESNGFIYRSTDYGTTWFTVDVPLSQWTAVASSGDGTRVVAVRDRIDVNSASPTIHFSDVFVSTDSCQTWTLQLTSNVSFPIYSVAISGDGTHIAAPLRGGQLAISPDAGLTWAFHWVPSYWASITLSMNGSMIAASASSSTDQNSPYYLILSSDAGETWKQVGSDEFQYLSVASSANGTQLIAIVFVSVNATFQNSSLFISRDSGLTWTAKGDSNPLRVWAKVYSSGDGNSLIAHTLAGFLYISVDSGESWNYRESYRAWMGATLSFDGSRMTAFAKVVSKDDILGIPSLQQLYTMVIPDAQTFD